MRKQSVFITLFSILSFNLLFANNIKDECTNLIVTKGATKTNSVMICYLCDAPFASHLQIIPAADHKKGEFISSDDLRGNVKVPQVPHTYKVIASNGIGHINEYQVAIGETTFEGRDGLANKEGLHYSDLMTIALQRSKTAREAVKIIGELAETYGYRAPGESISIGDKNEAWLMEIIGKGKEKGAVWVAVRIPDGYICAHANQSRIREFPLDDPENCLYSKDVISFAKKKGFYSPKDGPFSFSDTYHPADSTVKKICAMRVWSIFRRVASSLNLSPDYARGVKGAERYPLFVKPDSLLTTKDVFQLLRDHYEGTEFDMTKDGAFGNPYQKSIYKGGERGISTRITAFSIVTQLRSSLPDFIGGILWYSPDDTYFSCYVPFYCGIDEIPDAYTKGDRRHFSWDSAWWTFNFVSNWANIRYDKMIKVIQKEQSLIEDEFIKMQPVVEKTAQELYQTDYDAAHLYLTNYSVSSGLRVLNRWHKLADKLIVRYTR